MKKIKILFISLHGVLGKDKVIQSENNKLFSSDIQDGMGVTLALEAGIKVIVVGENFYPSSLRRACELKTTYQIVIDEKFSEKYKKLLEEFSANEDEIAWMVSDLDVMSFYKKAGLKIAILDANEEINIIADYVTKKPGGKGALREVVELIIKKNGDWDKIISKYL